MHADIPAPWFSAPTPCEAREAVVIGAGIAGCSISYMLSQRGLAVQLLDSAPTVAPGASGNTRCVIRPHLTRSALLLNAFNQDGFRHTLQTLRTLVDAGFDVDYAQPGVLQLLNTLGAWPTLDTACAVDAHDASKLARIRLNSPALHFPDGGWVNSAQLCQALVAASESVTLLPAARVSALSRRDTGWRVHCEIDDARYIDSSLVIVCAGPGTTCFDQLSFLDLGVSAGQTTRCQYRQGHDAPATVLAGKRFLVPEEDHCTIGATHWRDCQDNTPSAQDDLDNMAAIESLDRDLAQALIPVGQWRGLRASTPDRLPVAGAVPDVAFFTEAYTNLRHGRKHEQWPAARYLDGLYVLAGLGSRGLSTATLAAELLADTVTGNHAAATPLNSQRANYQQLLHPARFVIRRLRRKRDQATNSSSRRRNLPANSTAGTGLEK